MGCHFALRELSSCSFLAVLTNLRSPQRMMWWWAVAPESELFLPLWSLLWEMGLQGLRGTKGAEEAGLCGRLSGCHSTRCLYPFSSNTDWFIPTWKDTEEKKKSVWYLYLCWTKIWVLQLFEWLRHNYMRSWHSLYLQLFGKQHGQGLRLSGAVLWTVYLNVREGREGEGRLVRGWGGVLVFEISFDGPL